MRATRFAFVLLGQSPRPVATPTALSLLLAVGLLAVALLIPDRGDHHAAVAAELANVAITPANGVRPISLRDRLVVGLQARLKSEVAFVELVVEEVRLGHLPQRMVDQTFFWARQHSGIDRGVTANRPIIYFQPAMRARAQRIRVKL